MCYKPEDIVAFLTVIEGGGPSAAPRRGVTKSVASKHIPDLEGELAATLLRRWTNLVLWLERFIPIGVIPGRREAASPESVTTDRGHGFQAPSLRSGPGMTETSVRVTTLDTSVAA
jgi:hypothetical protein